MCTAISTRGKNHFFGRTLDLECSFGEKAVTVPRQFPFSFIHESKTFRHHAMVGTAHISDGVPLFYDAMNEKGLCAAALNFPEYAYYSDKPRDGINLASFELIPWLLCNFDSVTSAKQALERVTVTSDRFAATLPVTPLHWMIADKERVAVIEPNKDGLKIYSNPIGVLTNSPEFPYQFWRLSDYIKLSPLPPKNSICPSIIFPSPSRGSGALGLPGDQSSTSRFIRAAYSNLNTTAADSPHGEISRFFHILGTVNQPMGNAVTDTGDPIYTVYTSCMDSSSKTYYFTTYNNRQIRAIKLIGTDLGADKMNVFEMDGEESITILNQT